MLVPVIVLGSLCCLIAVPTLLLGLFRVPCIQRKVIYCSLIKLPTIFFPLHYSREGYHKAIILQTPDGERLGAWLYHKDFESVSNRVVLYLHGTAATRGFYRRYNLYGTLSQIFKAPVFCFDYRGFGDSSGSPTEDGILIDAITAWNNVIETHCDAKVVVWGHSLGSGVACKLVELISLSDNIEEDDELFEFVGLLAPNSKQRLEAMFLEAPFESLQSAIESHCITAPLRILPKPIKIFIMRKVIHLCDKFTSIDRITRIQVPTMILHGRKDWIIPYQQGIGLFSTLCDSLGELETYKKLLSVTDGKTSFSHPCRLVIFPKGGHNNSSSQENFTETISEFIASWTGGTESYSNLL